MRPPRSAHGSSRCSSLELGDIAAADREMQIVEGIAETSRQAYPRWVLAVTRAGRAFVEGRFADAEFLMARLDVMTWEHTVDATLAGGGSTYLLREQQGRASELLPELTGYARRYPHVPQWRVGLAACHTSLGQKPEARELLETLAGNDFADLPRERLVSRDGRVIGIVVLVTERPAAWLDAPRRRSRRIPFMGLIGP